MNLKNRKRMIVACILGIIIAWALLISNFFALWNYESKALDAIFSGLLIGNVGISCTVYVQVLKKLRNDH